MIGSMLLSLFFAITLSAITAVQAECCYYTHLGGHGGICADGTKATPCCGYGRCNVFCCACKGGCRIKGFLPSDTIAQDIAADDADDAFHLADADDSGNVTLTEYLDYMGASANNETYMDWYKQHDQDGNGVLTVNEVRL